MNRHYKKKQDSKVDSDVKFMNEASNYLLFQSPCQYMQDEIDVGKPSTHFPFFFSDEFTNLLLIDQSMIVSSSSISLHQMQGA